MQINFNKKLSAEVIRSLALRPEDLNLMNQMISVSGVQMSDREIVGTLLFSAEHGGLAGGIGGLIIGGMSGAFVGAVFTGLNGAIKKDAKIKLDIAYTRSDEAEVIAHNTDTARINKACDLLKLLTQRNLSGAMASTWKFTAMKCCNFAAAVYQRAD